MAKSNNMLIIIPSPGMGHLVSTIEFAKTSLRHRDSFSVNILVINPASTESGGFAKKFSDLNPDINFHDIPRPDPVPLLFRPNMSPETFISSYIESHKAKITEVVAELLSSSAADSSSLCKVSFVIDMFCTSMIDVANEFSAPCYTFFTSSAAFLGLIQYVTTRSVVAESETDLAIPSYVNPVPTSVLPSFMFAKDGYESFADHGKRFGETKGIIVNTFEELETSALSSLEGLPPVYSVGPVLDLARAVQISETKQAERDRILSWLDDQEKESVVFLCFGSLGSFKAEQVKEMAIGLEKSGVKFLWCLRKPPPEGGHVPTDFEDPNEILPEGFQARIGARGLICGWAPQIEILAHSSVGGFVTHCGWNSLLESIWFGVPTATWPLYAEQQINAFYMVKDLGLSVDLKMDYRSFQQELVSATEIENAVKHLMDDSKSSEIRRRVKVMSERSRAAMAEGGSSYKMVEKLYTNMLDE